MREEREVEKGGGRGAHAPLHRRPSRPNVISRGNKSAAPPSGWDWPGAALEIASVFSRSAIRGTEVSVIIVCLPNVRGMDSARSPHCILLTVE